MPLSLVDHLFVLYLAIAAPLHSVVDFRKLTERVAANDPSARRAFYRSWIAWSWIPVFGLLAFCWYMNRPMSELGMGFSVGTGFWISLALMLLLCGLMAGEVTMLRQNPEKMQAMRSGLEPILPMFPRDRQESLEFSLMGISAGICEEIIYRGYLMFYVSNIMSFAEPFLSILLSSVVFGLGHAYQGLRGILKTGVIGAIFAGLYWLSGSIWVPILLHIAIDITSGAMSKSLLAANEDAIDASTSEESITN
ncbi:MAG: CPBP family intramembrane glutamic endopeptidase [Planctomycetota bacterium]